jgi:Na+-translocating ferredoxin:NAD+ oxidoreductase subunit G
MKSILHMLVTLFVVGAVSGGALSLVNKWAAPKIAANELKEKMAGIDLVVPGGGASISITELITVDEAEAALLPDAYRVNDEKGGIHGWALVAFDNGFQDKIHLMVGLSADLNETRGLKILKDSETPGLGTKIRAGEFPAQFFKKADGYLNLSSGLKCVKGDPTADNEIAAITGATISSKAVVDIINPAVIRLRELLEKYDLLPIDGAVK